MLSIPLLAALSLTAALAAQQGAWTVVPGNPGPARWTTGRMAFDRGRGRCVLINGSEIWEAAGTTWRLAASGPAYGGMFGGFAYDRARRVAVWFGGGVVFYNNVTYEWDGSSWTAVPTAHAPSPRGFTAMTYDVARSCMVLFGGANATGALGDTWEFDGVDWQQRTPANSPGPLSRHRMTYDAARAEVVLFGAVNGQGVTWLYDGTDWRSGPAGPPAMIQPALVYDEARARTVLTTGNAQSGVPLSTWEWDGSAWTNVQPNGPVAYHTVSGAYDSVRGHVMLVAATDAAIDSWRWDGASWQRATAFGLLPALPGIAAAYHRPSATTVAFGGDLGAFFVVGDGTHEYRGGSWRQLQPPNAPGGRAWAAMATEPSGHVLLMGGRGLAVLGDSWRWNGTSWTQLAPATSPSPRSGHGMATDLGRGQVVLFGGQGAAANLLAETWEWDGSTWLLRAPSSSPPARVNPAMTYDPVRGRTLLFGGGSATTSFTDDLWQWDGTDWAPRATAVRPAERGGGQLTFDPQAGVAVLTGGFEYHVLGALVPVTDSWLWNDVSWTPIAGPAPTFATSGVAVYHEQLRSTVYTANGIDHEFAFGSVAAVTPFGSGCAGSAGPPELAGLSMPRTGNPQFAVWLSNARAGALAFVGFDTASAAIPLPGGCQTLLPAPVFAVTVTDAVGNARVPLPIPNAPALHGLALYSQALALDPNGGVLGLASLSAGLRIVLS